MQQTMVAFLAVPIPRQLRCRTREVLAAIWVISKTLDTGSDALGIGLDQLCAPSIEDLGMREDRGGDDGPPTSQVLIDLEGRVRSRHAGGDLDAQRIVPGGSISKVSAKFKKYRSSKGTQYLGGYLGSGADSQAALAFGDIFGDSGNGMMMVVSAIDLLVLTMAVFSLLR